MDGTSSVVHGGRKVRGAGSCTAGDDLSSGIAEVVRHTGELAGRGETAP